jgi:hypothetical protein
MLLYRPLFVALLFTGLLVIIVSLAVAEIALVDVPPDRQLGLLALVLFCGGAIALLIAGVALPFTHNNSHSSDS